VSSTIPQEWPIAFESYEDGTWLLLGSDRKVVGRGKNAPQVLECDAGQMSGRIDDLFPETPRGVWHALVVGAPPKKIKRKVPSGVDQEYELTLFPASDPSQRVAVLRKLPAELALGSVLLSPEGALKDQGQFRALYVISAGLAHEINNPLSVLLGSVANLKDKILPLIPDGSKAEFEKRLRTLELNLTRVHGVVTSLKSFVSAETLQTTPKSSRLEDILEVITASAPVPPKVLNETSGAVLPGSSKEVATALQLLLRAGPSDRSPAQVRAKRAGGWAEIQFTFDTSHAATGASHRVVDAMFDLSNEARVDSVGIAISTGIIEALKGHLSVERPSPEVLHLTVRLPLVQQN
jgi:hypothetical protein